MIQLYSYFQDHAVFQRGKWNPVFGKADAGNRLKMEFAGKTIFTKTNASGSFKFRFPPLEAGGPYSLKITDLENGDTAEIHDILIGEVWLASGQSNMEYNLSGKTFLLAMKGLEEPSGERMLEIMGKKTKKSDNLKTFMQNALARQENMVYSCLSLQPKSLEMICRETTLSVTTVTEAVMLLQLRGLVKEIGRNRYVKA